MAAPVTAQQQRINKEETTSRQNDHTAPAHGARQRVGWKLLEKRVLCDATGRPLQPSVAQRPVAKSGQEWLVGGVSPSQSRAHEWWGHGLSTHGPGQWTSSWTSGRWEREPEAHPFLRRRVAQLQHPVIERRKPSQLCPRGWHGKATPADEGVLSEKEAGRHRKCTPNEAMSSSTVVDQEKFRTDHATCRNNKPKTVGITSQGISASPAIFQRRRSWLMC